MIAGASLINTSAKAVWFALFRKNMLFKGLKKLEKKVQLTCIGKL